MTPSVKRKMLNELQFSVLSTVLSKERHLVVSENADNFSQGFIWTSLLVWLWRSSELPRLKLPEYKFVTESLRFKDMWRVTNPQNTL